MRVILLINCDVMTSLFSFLKFTPADSSSSSSDDDDLDALDDLPKEKVFVPRPGV